MLAIISAGSSSSDDRVLVRRWRFDGGFEVGMVLLLGLGEETCGVLARLVVTEEAWDCVRFLPRTEIGVSSLISRLRCCWRKWNAMLMAVLKSFDVT